MKSKNHTLEEVLAEAIYVLENTSLEEKEAKKLAGRLRFFAANTLGLDLKIKKDKEEFTLEQVYVCLFSLFEACSLFEDENIDIESMTELADLYHHIGWFCQLLTPYITEETAQIIIKSYSGWMMKELSDVLDFLSTAPRTDQSIIGQLAILEPTRIELITSGMLAFNYLFYFPEEGMRSLIRLTSGPERHSVSISAMSNITPKFDIEFYFYPGGWNCLYRDSTGREWPLEPEAFWQQLAIILDVAEDLNTI